MWQRALGRWTGQVAVKFQAVTGSGGYAAQANDGTSCGLDDSDDEGESLTFGGAAGDRGEAAQRRQGAPASSPGQAARSAAGGAGVQRRQPSAPSGLGGGGDSRSKKE